MGFIVKLHESSNNIKSRKWYNEPNKTYNGPTYEEFYESGTLKIREYRDFGHLHRTDGPALEEFYESGHLKRKIFCITELNPSRFRIVIPPTVLYRNPNGPAYEEYYESGKIKLRKWYACNNILYRDINDGPAYEEFYESGTPKLKKYNINNNWIHGLKIEEFNEDGTINKTYDEKISTIRQVHSECYYL